MALITWDSRFSVNVNEIDKQHQKLVSMINDLNDAMRQGKGKDVLGKIINGLITYTGTHFKTEEDYFDKLGYPDTAAHKDEHAVFVKKVSDFNADFQAGKLGVSIEVMNFLRDWLSAHIKGADKKYSLFLNDNGVW